MPSKSMQEFTGPHSKKSQVGGERSRFVLRILFLKGCGCSSEMEVRDVGQKMSHCYPPYSADMIIITVTIIIIVIISHFGGRERSGREDAKTQLEIVPG